MRATWPDSPRAGWRALSLCQVRLARRGRFMAALYSQDTTAMLHRRAGSHTIIPAINGKTIDEHFGRASSDTDAYSVAHMFALAGWHEPAQVGQFDEINVVVSGQLGVETAAGLTVVGPGESIQVAAGTRVRYRNASAQIPCEYWSLCVPAWRPDRVHIEAAEDEG